MNSSPCSIILEYHALQSRYDQELKYRHQLATIISNDHRNFPIGCCTFADIVRVIEL